MNTKPEECITPTACSMFGCEEPSCHQYGAPSEERNQILDFLTELDGVAIDFDEAHYGLPLHNNIALEKMVAIVRSAAAAITMANGEQA